MSKPGRPISLANKPSKEKTESQAVEEWGYLASVLLKRTMRTLEWGYEDLADGLKRLGIKRSPAVINRRINRGNFSAGFLLACLEVMQVRLDAHPKKNQAGHATPRRHSQLTGSQDKPEDTSG